jgi:CRISPR-associated endonuclease/helicase Cas3
MSHYSITLKPVYSCPAAEIPPDLVLPAGWTLAWHQLETWKALRDPNVDVVFNTAMTGDGKSLAAYLDVLQGDCFAIALYPTNALASDQEMQMHDYISQFKPSNEPRVNRLSGPELEIYAENEGLRKGSAIASRAGQSEVLITNPDIFHYLHRGAYLTDKDTPDKLWNRIDKDFDLFIFDEFHVFAAPQVASVLNTMLLIQVTNRRKKFLFLSATPSSSLLKRLEKAGFRCHIINPMDEGKYQFPESQSDIDTLKEKQWRQVARSIDLTFVPLEPTSKSSETWLKENQDSILNQFLEHPGSKGAIILNSIAAVKRLTPVFRELFASHDLTVRENTGLSGTQEKAESLSADLVIGTSTIDIGVDFKINLLIFESSDAGNFIQRLGRLGRHDGYQKNGHLIEFDGFKAYALVPNFFVERLFAGENAVLKEGEVCDRIHFQTLIRENYRRINDFDCYYKRWGAIQSVSLGRQLSHAAVKAQYKDSVQKFQKACEQVFETRFGQVFRQMKGWSAEWHDLTGQKSSSPIAEDARSFRGSSPLQCGLYDLTESNECDRFKTYDLPGVLSNLEIEMWSKAAFLDTLRETATRTGQPIAKGRFKHCLGFMKLRSYREERLNWKFTYSGDLQPIADAYKVQVLIGLQVWQPDNPWASAINQQLKKQALVCYVLRKPVREVRLRLQLPMHFQIYPISDGNSVHDANAPCSVTFGQSALLIDTLAHRFRNERCEIWVV